MLPQLSHRQWKIFKTIFQHVYQDIIGSCITQTKIDFYQPVLDEISSALVGSLLVWGPKQLLMPQAGSEKKCLCKLVFD